MGDEFHSIFFHIFAPTGERLTFSHLGREACCKGKTQLRGGPAAGLLLLKYCPQGGSQAHRINRVRLQRSPNCGQGPAGASSLCLFCLASPLTRDSSCWRVSTRSRTQLRVLPGRCCRALSTVGLCGWRSLPLPSAHTQPPHPCLLSHRELRLMIVPLMLSAATFLSDKGLSQVMNDISQNLLYASSYKYLAFLGLRRLLGMDMFLGSLPLPPVDVRMFLWVNAKSLPGG